MFRFDCELGALTISVSATESVRLRPEANVIKMWFEDSESAEHIEPPERYSVVFLESPKTAVDGAFALFPGKTYMLHRDGELLIRIDTYLGVPGVSVRVAQERRRPNRARSVESVCSTS